jgi:tetratricopeptide (TPR) repeat protein
MKTLPEMTRRAGALMEQGAYSEAEAILERVLAKNPGDGIALYMIGTIYSMARRNGLAIPYLATAASILKNGHPEARVACLANLACVLTSEGHIEESAKAAHEALRIDPRSAISWNNLASGCINRGVPEEGEMYARKSLEIEESPEARQNLGQCLLEQGKWAEGWDSYEARFGCGDYLNDKRSYKASYWNGEKTGTLVIHGEQGLGDEIMFLSLAHEAMQHCDRLVIEANNKLRSILRRSLGVEVVSTQEEAEAITDGKIDHVIGLGSLGRLYRRDAQSFSKQKPYLKADPMRVAYWRKRLESTGPGPYIALAWRGGSLKTHEGLRNPPKELFIDLIKNIPAKFISVQYTKDAPVDAYLWGMPHWQGAIDDLDEQAALISACDMTISVAQTALHLAGALGKPAIGLIGSKPAWRYQMSGEKMAWYESVKLVRQEGDDWNGLFRKVIDGFADNGQLQAA